MKKKIVVEIGCKIKAPNTKNKKQKQKHLGSSCFCSGFLIGTKNMSCREQSNMHSYQVWFQFAQWFQRKIN